MILITGASSGFGKACAEVFAEQKKNLFLIARRLDRLKEIQSDLQKKHGIQVEIAELDVSNKKAVKEFGKEFSKTLAQVDVLVNNAGLAIGRNFIQDGNPDDWDIMWDTNVKGLLYMTHEVLPHLIAKKSGHIINLGSAASRWAYPQGNIYAATKKAVSGLTESLRLDLQGKGIRVTEIAPGMAETEFSVVRLGGDAAKAKDVYKGMDPLTARDIAEAVAWTVSRPKHVNIQEMVIYPTDQASTSQVFRRS